jgi:hypothetical protein
LKTIDIEEIYHHWEKVKDGSKSSKTLDAYRNISRIIKETYHDYSSYRDERARIIEKNLFFYKGEMHLDYDVIVKNYRIKPVTPYNKYIPRPTTNLIQPRVDTIASLFSRNKPKATVRENSNTREDINKARMGEWLLDAKWEIDNETINALDMIMMGLLCGTCYRKDGWSNDTISNLLVNGKRIDKGDTFVDLFSPLEVIADYNNGNRNIDRGDFIMEFGLSTVDKIKRAYDLKEKGYTGLAKNIQKDPDTNYTLSVLNRLKTTASNEGGGDDLSSEDAALRIETYIHPIKKHEKGLMIVTGGDEVVYIDECKYTLNDGTNWNPYSEFQWTKDPLSHLGLSIVEQITALNERYNTIDALIILNRRLNVAPQWVYKIGSLIANQQFTGAPGASYGYKGDTPPQRMPGLPLDGSVWKEKEDIKQRMTEIAGDNEVLSGERPQGVTTASQMNMLLNQSYGKFNPKTQRWEKCWEKAMTKKLNNMKKFMKESRPEIVSEIQIKNPKMPKAVIEDFFTDDGIAIGDNLQVRVEVGSTLPRSEAYEQEKYKEMAQAGMFGPLDPNINPLGNKEYLRKMGIENFPHQTNPQLDRAQNENDQLRQRKYDEVEVFPIDSPILHYQIHMNEFLELMSNDFFGEEEADIFAEYLKHILEHFIMLNPQEKQSIGINESMNMQLTMIANSLGLINPLDQLMPMQQPFGGPPVLGQEPQLGNMPGGEGLPLTNPIQSVGGM